MATKKRDEASVEKPKKKTTKPAARPAGKPAGRPAARPEGRPAGRPAARPEGKPTGKPAGKAVGKPTGKPPRRAAASGSRPTAPRIRSHAVGTDAPPRTRRAAAGRGTAVAAAVSAGRGVRRSVGPAVRKTPLVGPKRTVKRSVPPDALPQASSAARELAIALAAAGLEKKAVGIEILDVSGKVDYADFLVIMTGRSDRHVYSIAMGLEEGMRTRKLAPLSVEGLTASTWVLIDFGDVVVHVFQEDARSLYDIEGLWMDAGRVPVPADGPASPA